MVRVGWCPHPTRPGCACLSCPRKSQPHCATAPIPSTGPRSQDRAHPQRTHTHAHARPMHPRKVGPFTATDDEKCTHSCHMIAQKPFDAIEWHCNACTFLNSGYLDACEICDTRRAKAPNNNRAVDVVDIDEDAASMVQPASAGGKASSSNSSEPNGPVWPNAPALSRLSHYHERRSGTSLTDTELSSFLRDGYIVLKGVMPRSECDRLLYERVAPALAQHGGIDPFNERTWGGLDGTVVKARVGPNRGDHPIPLDCPDGRWPALFRSERLLGVLDQLHGGAGRWTWAYGAADGLGWIHVRFPIHEGSAWAPPEEGWHVDGGSPDLNSRASVVALPLLTTIRPGGGGTALLRGSHRRVADLLHQGRAVRPLSLAKSELKARGPSAVVEATGRAGDVLLLHPLLVHAPSSAHRATWCSVHQPHDIASSHAAPGGSSGPPMAVPPSAGWVKHGLRITFNLATQWNSDPTLSAPGEQPRSPLEGSLGFGQSTLLSRGWLRKEGC